MGRESVSNRPTTHPTSQPMATNAARERALAAYKPGMSRRQLADAAGLTQYQAYTFLKEIQALNPHEPA
jgi:hypothetical protein